MKRISALVAVVLAVTSGAVSTMPEEAAAATEQIVNPGFESGDADYWTASDATLTVTDSEFHDGSKSLLVSARTETYSSARQELIVENGSTYTASGWVRLASGADTATMVIRVTGPGFEEVHEIDSATATGTGWVQLTGSRTLDERGPIDFAEVYVQTATSTADMFVDDFSVAGASQAEPGRTYYVSPSGDDSGPGTRAAPFRTIGHAASVMEAGDDCVIREGTYRETVAPASSGTWKRPITYEAYPGETVTVTGADVVTGGWTPRGDGIYSTDVALGEADRNQVFVDGDMVDLARWPNDSDDNRYTDVARADTADATSLTHGGLSAFGDGSLAGAKLWIRPGNEWTTTTTTITGSTAGAIEYDPVNPSDERIRPVARNDFYIFDSLALLDAADEWYYDDSAQRLYLRIAGGGSPSSTTVEVKSRQRAFDLSDRDHTTVRGVDVFASTIVADGGEYNVIDRIDASYVGHKSTIDAEYWFDDNGISISGNHNTLSNSEIAYSSANLVTAMWGADNVIVNNRIHDADYNGNYANAVFLGGDRPRLSHNTIFTTGRDAISNDAIRGGVVEYNEVYDSGLISSDSAGYYTYGTDGQGTEIRYNWFHDQRAHGAGAGIYLDNYAANYKVHHNVTWDMYRGIQVNSNSEANLVYNNTVVGGNLSGLTVPDDKAGTFVVNNIFDNRPGLNPVDYTAGSRLVQRYNLLNIDPLLGSSDPDERRFTPRATSPAIDAGQVIAGITDGYLGDAPDVGAYEYGGEAWSAGSDLTTTFTADGALTTTDHQNMVDNPSFETADSSGWYAVAATVDPDGTNGREGKHAVQLSPGGYISQVVHGLTPDTEYEIGAWVRMGPDGEVDLGVKNHGGAETTTSYTARGSYSRQEIAFTTGPSSTSAEIFLWRSPEGTAPALGDHLLLHRTDAATASATPARVVMGYPALTTEVNAVERLSAQVLPLNASPTALTWSSSDPAVVTVDSEGNVTGEGIGTATVTARLTRDGTISASTTVEVLAETPYTAQDFTEALGDTGDWVHRSNAPTFVNGGIELGGGTPNSTIGYDRSLDPYSVLGFRLRLGTSPSAWTQIGISSEVAGRQSWQGSSGYSFGFSNGGVTLDKTTDRGMRTLQTGDGVSLDDWHDVEIGTVSTTLGTRIVLKVDGEYVINVIDRVDPITTGGHVNVLNLNTASDTVYLYPPTRQD